LVLLYKEVCYDARPHERKYIYTYIHSHSTYPVKD